MVYILATEHTPLLLKNGFVRFKGNIQLRRKKDSNAFGVRHVQSLLMFFGMAFGYFLRVNISAAIVPMTKPRSEGDEYYDWDPSTKSLILSSFFWGYVVAQVPSGLLAKRFGGKLVLGIATVLASIITMLHPWAASSGSWQVVCFLRVLIGLTQGVLYPSVHTLLAKWAPRTERSFLATSVYSGAQLGTVIILATSGFIFDSSMGWPGIFYISGAVALAWSIVFLVFGADSPKNSNVISSEEREYIDRLTGSGLESTSMPVPWKSLFTSAPFYGLIAAQTGFTWGFYTLLTEIPTYMDAVLKLNVASNALLSALPYFVMWLLCLIVSPISDMLINRNVLSTTVGRKLFNTIGQWIPMACLIGMSYMTSEESVEAITLLTIGVGFNSAAFCGYLVNHMDLSPNFAGPMMSISNGFGNLLSLFAPLVVGAIVKDEEEPSEWRIVFFITAGVYLVCNTLFIIFGQATIQPWNDPTNLYRSKKSQEIESIGQNTEATITKSE